MKIFVEYPAAYTVEAQGMLAEHFGGIENIEQAFESGTDIADDVVKLMENTIFLVSAILKGGENRERVRCKMLGVECTAKAAPTFEELCAVLTPDEIPELLNDALKIMSGGNATTMDVEEPEGKNAKATQSE